MQINLRDTPDLAEAAKVSLTHRGANGGWPGAWQVSLWARLGDGNRARSILMEHCIPGFTANLFNGKRVYQIDGNMGVTAGIAELLLQSHLGGLHLLPALPSDWHTGTVRGLRGRGGFEVDMTWEKASLKTAKITSHLGGPCEVRCQGKSRTIETVRGSSYGLDENLDTQESLET
jgi:alpha-L-fucosidase 2